MEKKRCIDQLGRLLEFNFPPQRIISLVPSQTELLFDLGLANRVIGITKFCVHPNEWFTSKTKVGGTKKFNFNVINSLQPDLILGNKEENYEEGITDLASRYPVWLSDITSWESALAMIREVGNLVDENAKAELLLEEIKKKFEKFKPLPTKRVLYFIWKNPWMAAGKNTFIDAVLSKIGLVNRLEIERYPELSFEDVKKLSPEIILLSSEPFPFQQKHIDELQLIFPTTRIILVDGEMFSWYGSRMLKAADYFTTLDL
ncbi:MAG TPA: helical backbone metal receptor [Cyclobacteriaceae bacterium]|jgi:ABC-type Fe3+-hydroxamate transport system substrate-binding protein|nr:helical backbone metal receptor [Cyclobacteriaceae bacterium]